MAGAREGRCVVEMKGYIETRLEASTIVKSWPLPNEGRWPDMYLIRLTLAADWALLEVGSLIGNTD